MKLILTIIILIILFAYEKIYRNKVCRKKIFNHVSQLGGKINEIKKLTPRDEIYIVYYSVDEELKKATVKFTLTYNEIWN